MEFSLRKKGRKDSGGSFDFRARGTVVQPRP